MFFKCSVGAVSFIFITLLGLWPCFCRGQQTAHSPGTVEQVAVTLAESDRAALEETFQIEGRAVVYGVRPEAWAPSSVVLVDGEEHVGFIRFFSPLNGLQLYFSTAVYLSVHILNAPFFYSFVQISCNL